MMAFKLNIGQKMANCGEVIVNGGERKIKPKPKRHQMTIGGIQFIEGETIKFSQNQIC